MPLLTIQNVVPVTSFLHFTAIAAQRQGREPCTDIRPTWVPKLWTPSQTTILTQPQKQLRCEELDQVVLSDAPKSGTGLKVREQPA